MYNISIYLQRFCAYTAFPGSSGSYPNNMHRDLAKHLGEPMLPAGFETDMWLLASPSAATLHKQHILLPHEMFASIYHDYPQAHPFIHARSVVIGG
jgi:hypothetical protein